MGSARTRAFGVASTLLVAAIGSLIGVRPAEAAGASISGIVALSSDASGNYSWTARQDPMQQWSIFPAVPASENVNITGIVTNPAAPTGFGGIEADLTVDDTIGGGTWSAAPLPGYEHPSPTDGILVWRVSHPNPKDGDAAKVTWHLQGTNQTVTVHYMYQTPRIATSDASAVNAKFGSAIPNVTGTMELSSDTFQPDYIPGGLSWNQVSTVAGSTAAFHATVRDQFGQGVDVAAAKVSVTGRNPATATVTPASFSLTDTGNPDQATTADASTFDQVSFALDANADGVADTVPAPMSFKRTYRLDTSGNYAAIEAGIGSTPTQQWSGDAAPFTPKTDDDEIVVSLDPTKTGVEQPIVPIYMQARDATNRTHYPSRGDIYAGVPQCGQGIAQLFEIKSGAYTNTYLNQCQGAFKIGSDGFARAGVRSSKIGTTTVNVSSLNGRQKTLKITWTNEGLGATITRSGTGSRDLAIGKSVTETYTVKDRFGNRVAKTAVTLELEGPGKIGSGGSKATAITNAAGQVSFPITVTGPGPLYVEASAAGSWFTRDSRFSDSVIYGLKAGMPALSKTKFLVSSDRFAAKEPVTVSAQVFDINGHWAPKQKVKISVSVPGASVTRELVTDAKGNVSFTFTPPRAGKSRVDYTTVYGSNSQKLWQAYTTFDLANQTPYPAPEIDVDSNSGGNVKLKAYTYNTFKGLKMQFFKKVGSTNVSLGVVTIANDGTASINATFKPGEKATVYCTLLNPNRPFTSTTSTNLTFTVK